MVFFRTSMCLVMMLVAAGAVAEDTELVPIEQVMLSDLNAARVQRGLHPLVLDMRLQKSARRHCAWMANRHVLQHAGGVAENIAMGQRSSKGALRDWLNSSGHRANLLSRGYRRCGVAAYVHPRRRVIFWCQQFSP